jgi:uncharacterized protein (TIGR02246 family)
MKKIILLTGVIFVATFFVDLLATDIAAQEKAQSLTLSKGVVPHTGIDAIYKKFSVAYRQLDPAMVTNLYTRDALYLAPGGNIERGRDYILQNFTEFFGQIKEGGGKLEISFEIRERRVASAQAYDVGIYTLKSISSKGETRISQGKFITIARRQKDGVWRFQVDGYSDIQQPGEKP